MLLGQHGTDLKHDYINYTANTITLHQEAVYKCFFFPLHIYRYESETPSDTTTELIWDKGIQLYHVRDVIVILILQLCPRHFSGNGLFEAFGIDIASRS